MVDLRWVQMMARYNAWQNDSIYAAADKLDDTVRREDKGAFFKSIHGTLSHILWADKLWLARLTAQPANFGTIPQSPMFVEDWETLKSERQKMDGEITAWAAEIQEDELGGDFVFFSHAQNAEIRTSRSLCITHVFNHQTHHRGQVHAMLTASGVKPNDTDLPFMPAA